MPPDPTTSPLQLRPRFTWTGLAWVLLPIGAWLVGMLWLGGDLGRCTDDYSVNFRDPATGDLPSPFNPWARYPFFWRPLHNLMCFGVGTLLAEHWRVVMVFCAIMHGLACLCVYRLLRASTRLRGPAVAGALVLLLHPMNFEVAFWFCSISAAIATSLWCLYTLWCIQLIRRPRGARPLHLLGLAALAFVIPCFYEQAATGVLALPFILLAAWLGSRRGAAGPRLGPAFGRAVLLSFIAGAMNVVYIALLRLTAPDSFRGGAASFVKPELLGKRIGEVAGSVQWQLAGNRLDHTVRGSWQVGLDALQTPVGIAAACALGLLVLIWAWAWWNDSPATDGKDVAQGPHRSLSAASRLCWIASGAILFVGAFIPIAMMARQNVEPRTLYFSLVGIALVLAQLLDLALAATPEAGAGATIGRAARAAAAILIGAAAVSACVCCVGVQQWCSLRAHRDVAIAQRLAELIPDPPANAVYVPLALDAGPSSTGLLLFDRLRPGAFNTTWSATALMQESTRRRGVLAAAINPWAKFPLDRFSSEGFWTSMKLDGRASEPGQRGEFVAWERVIPFAVDDAGRVRLVRQIDITRPDERVDTFHPPLVRAAIRAGTARGHATALTLADSADSPPQPLTGWRLTKAAPAEEPLAFPLRTSRGTQRPATWLHPTFDSGARAAMEAALEPSPQPGTIRFHITTPPEGYVRFPKGEPVTLHFELMPQGDATSPLVQQSVEVTRERADAETNWIVIDLHVPTLAEAAAIRIRTTSKRGADSAPVWVTPGMWISTQPVPMPK